MKYFIALILIVSFSSTFSQEEKTISEFKYNYHITRDLIVSFDSEDWVFLMNDTDFEFYERQLGLQGKIEKYYIMIKFIIRDPKKVSFGLKYLNLWGHDVGEFSYTDRYSHLKGRKIENSLLKDEWMYCHPTREHILITEYKESLISISLKKYDYQEASDSSYFNHILNSFEIREDSKLTNLPDRVLEEDHIAKNLKKIAEKIVENPDDINKIVKNSPYFNPEFGHGNYESYIKTVKRAQEYDLEFVDIAQPIGMKSAVYKYVDKYGITRYLVIDFESLFNNDLYFAGINIYPMGI